uniref:F-box domain-containing protein n=1 Tax=Plectus sambesii TaxID=2011161 RepID=A0A914VJ05_9BILA
MSKAALKAEVVRLQAENDRLRRALADIHGQIVCGRLTGDLPDNFLEQFSHLPDRPLEQVLRFLPPGQVAQMRHVSRRFNHLIRKCSKTMPKKECNDSVAFDSNNAGQLTVERVTIRGKIITRTTSLVGNEVALSELLRFIHIGGKMWFAEGLSAADEVLDQLSKSWLTIRPEEVFFSGDLSQTSRDSLRAFFVKVEPSIRSLNFQYAYNIPDSLLSGDVIGAAGGLDGLMVMPAYWEEELRDINVDDDILLALVDAGRRSSNFFFMACSGFTPGGIRAFVEKWMGKERPHVDANFRGTRWPLEVCELAFYECANVTPDAVDKACGDLLKKETTAGFFNRQLKNRVLYSFQRPSTNRRLEISFLCDAIQSRFVIKSNLYEEIVCNNKVA